MRFTSLFVLATAVVSGFAQTVADVEADIATISSDVTSLDTLINNYPSSGGTLAGALAIHNAATALVTTLNDATSDVTATPGPISDSDANTILSSVQAIVPTIQDALVGIVAKKPAFDALPLGGVTALVKQDITNLQTANDAFADSLIAAAPSDLTATATALKAQIDGYFATAKAGYA